MCTTNNTSMTDNSTMTDNLTMTDSSIITDNPIITLKASIQHIIDAGIITEKEPNDLRDMFDQI